MPHYCTKALFLGILFVMVLVVGWSGYSVRAQTNPTTSSTTATQPSSGSSSKDSSNMDNKQPPALVIPKQLSKETYDKVMATMDALLKRLHQQHLALKSQVENAQMQLLIAQKDEEQARQTYEKLQKQYFTTKLQRASMATKLKAALKAFKQAQKASKSSLSRYNKMIKAKADVEGKYESERRKLASLKKKAQELLDVRNINNRK